MGYYINETSTGKELGPSYRDKVSALIGDGAIEFIPTDSPTQLPGFGPDLVCVIDNGPFAAAAYIYSEREYEEFAKGNGQKQWLIYPHAKKLSGYEG